MHLDTVYQSTQFYAINSLCHNCYTFEYIYLYIFQVHILLKRHLPRDSSISCPAYHLELTNNNSFAWLIWLYMWLEVVCCPSELGGEMLPLRSGIRPKHLNTILYIWPSLSRGHHIVTIMIHYRCCLMASRKWSPDT